MIRITDSSILQATGLCKQYRAPGGAVVRALDGVDLSLDAGDLVSITGPSGSGKSTLLHLLGLLDRPSQGSITFDGRPTRHMGDRNLSTIRNRGMGFVFQDDNILPHLTVLENVLIPAIIAGNAPDARKQARDILDLFGLGAHERRKGIALSGGEKQRVAVARALVNGPKVIFADEPTGPLDSENSRIVMDALRTANEAGAAVVYVSHDPDEAALARQRLLMRDGGLAP